MFNAFNPTSHIILLDDNSSYGHSMKLLPPTETHYLVNPEKFNLDNYSNDDPIGCFWEGGSVYPDKLYDSHLHRLAAEKSHKRVAVWITTTTHRGN